MNETTFKLIITFLCLSTIPDFMQVAFKTSSTAAGLGISLGVVFVLFLKEILNDKYDRRSVLLFTAIAAILLLSTSYSLLIYGYSKPLLSLPIFLLLILLAHTCANAFDKLQSETFINIVFYALMTLIALGWLKLFYMPNFLNYSDHYKAVFPFREESKYALLFSLFATAYCFVGKVKWIVFIALNSLLLSITFPSLTLLIATAIQPFGLLIRFNRRLFIYSIFFIVPISLFIIINLATGIEYFASRLSFRESDNLTTLVFLQGWDLAIKNFIDTKGLGLGFQMLGSEITKASEYAIRITDISNRTVALNLADGGFIVSKIVAELGLIGIIITAIYIRFLFNSTFLVNSIYNKFVVNESEYLKKYLLMHGFVFGFFIQMFFRGYGYFSTELFIVIACAIYINRAKKRSLLIRHIND